MLRFVDPVPAGAEPALSEEGAQESSSSNFDIGLILKQCLSRPWLIALSTLVMMAVGLAFAKMSTPSYIAATQVLVDPTNLSLIQNDITPPVQQGDAGVSAVESQLRIITSGNVLQRVIKTLDLTHDSDFMHGSSSIAMLTAKIFGARDSVKDTTAAALDILQQNVSVRRPERTYIVDISVKDSSSERAARIANAIPQAYLEERTSSAAETARRASASLGARLDELRENVRKADTKLAKFREDNNLIGSNGRLISDQQLSDIVAQQDLAKGRTRQALVRLNQMRAFAGDPLKKNLPEVVEAPEVRALRSQLNALMRTEAELANQLGDLHPSLAAIRSQIQAGRKQLEKEAVRVIDTARNEMSRSFADEEALKKQMAELKQQLAKDADALVAQRQIEREAEAQRAIYEAFLRRSREAGEQAEIDRNNVHVLTLANAPVKPKWPPPTALILMGSAIVGIILGLAGSFFLDMREGRHYAVASDGEYGDDQEAGDAIQSFDVDVFPPPYNLARQKKRLPQNTRKRSYIFSNLTDLPLDVISAPNSDFSRSVNALFNDLYDGGRSPKIVLTADIAHGFDAATLAANFALAGGKAGRDALLVEADPDRFLIEGLGVFGTEKSAISDNGLTFYGEDEELAVALAEASEFLHKKKTVFESSFHSYDVVVIHGGFLFSPHIRFFAQLCDQIVLVGSIEALEGSTKKIEKLEQDIARHLKKTQNKIAAIVAMDDVSALAETA